MGTGALSSISLTAPAIRLTPALPGASPVCDTVKSLENRYPDFQGGYRGGSAGDGTDTEPQRYEKRPEHVGFKTFRLHGQSLKK